MTKPLNEREKELVREVLRQHAPDREDLLLGIEASTQLGESHPRLRASTMNYLRVGWKHQHLEEPVRLYSELDSNRREVRKVEIFHNGGFGYASPEASSGNTKLGEVPVPELNEVVKDPQFEPVEITRAEFEEVWARCNSRP